MIILAYGMPGAGKSTLLHDLVGLDCHERLYFVCDQTAEWGPGAAHWRGRAPEIHFVHGGQAPPSEDDLEAGVVVFRGWEPEDVAQAAIDRGDVTYVDDEIDVIGGKDAKWNRAHPLRAIVHRGRHIPNAQGRYCQIHVLGACRRPANLQTDLSGLADQVFVFRLHGANNLDRLLKDNHLAEGEEEKLLSAPNFTCRHWPSGRWYDVDPL